MKKKGLLSGLLIVFSGKLGWMTINFLTIIFLARLLEPRDFGILAMCSIFLSISEMLVDSGMAGSLIFQKDIEKIDKNTLFWFNLFVSLVLYMLLFFLAPFIADFYNTPILKRVVRVIALSIVIHSCCYVQNAILIKELRYKEHTVVTLISALISTFIVISMAYLKYGIWALIAQTISFNIIQVILLFIYVRFVPRLEFSFKVLKKHWAFGSKLLGSNFLNILYTNMYVQIIGKIMDVKTAGFYQQAKKLNDFPRNLIQYPFDKVFFPHLVRSSDLKTDCNIIFRRVSFFIIPLLFYLSMESSSIIKIILGDKWIDASWMSSLMFIGTIGISLENINRSFIKSFGNTTALLKNDILMRILNVGILLIALRWQIRGILLAFVINGFLGWLMNCYVFCKLSNQSIFIQLKIVLEVILISIFCCTFVKLITYDISSIWATFFSQSCLFFLIYFLLMFPFFKNDVNKLIKKYGIGKKDDSNSIKK